MSVAQLCLFRTNKELSRLLFNFDNYAIVPCVTRILAIRIDTLGENHTNVAMVYRNLGTLEFAEEKFDVALDYYEKSLKIFEVR